jgi:hypothetical protein
VEYVPSAGEPAIAAIESRFDVRLPAELRSFLLETDGATIGVQLNDGRIVPDASWLVWSLAEMTGENERFPTGDDYTPNNVFFFVNAGVDGIRFGHSLDAGRLRDDVVVWYPMEHRLEQLAPSFRAYLERWLTGEIAL